MRARSVWAAAAAVATRSFDKGSWKVLPGEGLGPLEQWLPPSLGPAAPSPVEPAPAAVEPEPEDLPPEQARVPTLEQIEAIQQQAYEEGLEQGRAQGFEHGHREALEAGRKQIAEHLARFDALMQTLDAPFKDLDDQVERELLTLVVSMVRQLVRREVRTDPNQIVGVMREALSILPVSSRNIRVLLHPEDAELVRKLYPMDPGEQGWRIVEDPVLERGGCRVVSDSSQVDATLESRLNNLIGPLLGRQRSEDAEGGEE
jgi:flagellar assembly protein FliH